MAGNARKAKPPLDSRVTGRILSRQHGAPVYIRAIVQKIGWGAGMRTLLAMLFCMMLLAPGAQAQPPLPAGKPAGAHQAALGTTGMIIVVALGASIVTGALGIAFGNATSSGRT